MIGKIEQEQYYLWQPIQNQEARLWRIYGETEKVQVPDLIEGRRVTEIAPYCFARAKRIPEEGILVSGNQTGLLERYEKQRSEPNDLLELCGDEITEVELPDTIHKIGNCGFYDCRKLEKLSFGSTLTEIGSDAFMNCRALRELTVRADVSRPSGIRVILNQIQTEVEVCFAGSGEETRLLYPEYSESYEEIGPAHIFGLNITGEGFRLRRCFQEEKVSFAQYDSAFEKACVEEMAPTLWHLSLDRLRYPRELSGAARVAYENYIREQQAPLVESLVRDRKLPMLEMLFRQKLVEQTTAERAVALAGEEKWPEGMAQLMQWKAVYFAEDKRKRYEFDAF